MTSVAVVDVGEVTSRSAAGAPTSGPSSSKPAGGALAFGWFGVKERDGVNATTSGGSIWERQMEHSCSSRRTSLTSSRAKAWRSPPECVIWRPAESQRNVVEVLRAYFRQGGVPGGVGVNLRCHGVSKARVRRPKDVLVGS